MKKLCFLPLMALCGSGVWAQQPFVNFENSENFRVQRGDIAVGDINGDGWLDIIMSAEKEVENVVERGAVLVNDGNDVLSFTKYVGESRIIRPGKHAQIKWGDINGDGALDVIFNGNANTGSKSAGIALGDGSGGFTLADPAIYPMGTGKISCGFADFNLDGLMDYYVFGNGIGNCHIYIQRADGAFDNKPSVFGSPDDFFEPYATIVDFNNDGYPDIFLQVNNETAYAAGMSKRWCATYVNDGFGNFTHYPQPNILHHKANGSVDWADIDGDGWLDLIFGGDGWENSSENLDTKWRIFKNNRGTFEEKQVIEPFRQAGIGKGVRFVDWDGDGKIDVIVGGWSPADGGRDRQVTALYLGTDPANFTFTESPLTDNLLPGVSEQVYELADLNNDGKPDLLMMGYSGAVANVYDYNRRIFGYVLNPSTAASVKPDAPTSLLAEQGSEETSVKFTWTAPASESGNYGTTYNFALKNTDANKWLYNPMSVTEQDTNNGWRKIAGGGNLGAANVCESNTCALGYELFELPDGNYQWSVQAINGAFTGGTFAAMQRFTITDGILSSTGSAALTSLSAQGYTLTPAFAANIMNYTLTVPNDVTAITIAAVAADGMTITGIGEKQLQVGINTITITVANAADQSSRTYNIKVTRSPATAVETEMTAVLSVHPNPVVDGQLIIDDGQLESGEYVEIYDINGALLMTATGSVVNIAALPAGAYIVKVCNKSTKIIKNN